MLELVEKFLLVAKSAESSEGSRIIDSHKELNELLKPAIEQMRHYVAYEHGHRVSEEVARLTQEEIAAQSAGGKSKNDRIKAADIHVQVNKEIFG